MVETKGSLMIESFPTSRRLLVPELSHLRGHWAENDIKALYSLESSKKIRPVSTPGSHDESRVYRSHCAGRGRSSERSLLVESDHEKDFQYQEEITSPFIDVPTGSKYFESITMRIKGE